MSLKEQIQADKIPVHIAVIMDGNGRWAQQRGKDRIFGHQSAVESVRQTTEAAAELGVRYLTLYTFSTENWGRPQQEIDGLMELLVNTIHNEIPTLNKNGIRLFAIGDLTSLPGECASVLKDAIEQTKGNNTMQLNLALSYSSRWEIINAVKNLAADVESGQLASSDIDEKCFEQYLQTKDIPDPELLIRTSGEMRISNYLLWQIAYAELYFTPTLWPDFRKEDLYKAIIEYQQRERRFGKTGQQIKMESGS